MTTLRWLVVIALGLTTVAVRAQTDATPLNLQLPPSDLPAAASTTAAKPKPASGGTSAPGVYYGDTSGSTGNDQMARAPVCDDSTYNQTQTHGSVSTGIVSASHFGTGTWGAGTVSMSKAFGSCEHPTGGVNFSISVGSGRFHGRGF